MGCDRAARGGHDWWRLPTTRECGEEASGFASNPFAHSGFESDSDFVGGRDYQGYQRNETAFSVNGLFYANAKSPVSLYFLAGIGWSWAHAVCDLCSGAIVDDHYVYFGGQLGVGLEARVSRSFAFNVDLRGFVRGRVDRKADSQPEFVEVDANGGINARPTLPEGVC